MKKQDYTRNFNLYQELTHQWHTLLKQMVSDLGGVTFDNPPHVPVISSSGEWQDIQVSEIAVTDDGELVLTDCSDADNEYWINLEGDAAVILVSEILKQTDWQFEE